MKYPIDIKLLQCGGCYLFFDSWQFVEPSVLLPLYAGRASNLLNRLGNHWGPTENFIDTYQKAVMERKEEFKRKDVTLSAKENYKLFPTGLSWVAFWQENDARERMFFEHQLIYKCRPMYNRN